MIQRKQTLFLAAVTIIGILMMILPFQSFNDSNSILLITLLPRLDNSFSNSNIVYPIILNIITIVLSVITLLLFKKRVIQYKLANLLILLNVFILGLYFLLSFVNEGSLVPINYEIGACFPLISAIFSFLAAYYIKKDEQLVRSADRIR